MTLTESLRWAVDIIACSDSPRLDAEVLLCHVLGCERSYLYTWPERELSDQQLGAFQDAVTRRQQGEPVAHITGEREFWSLPLQVTPDTLIPRPETELLVEVALDLPLPTEARVLDLGTGTGAIALALASERAAWQVDAVDVVAAAVTLAARNGMRLNLDNVQVWQSRWFDSVDAGDYQLIISNPPYIDPADRHLDQGDVRFEPHSALVAKDAGLADIRTIVGAAPDHLQHGGWLLLEHGYDQGQAVRQLFRDGGFGGVQTRRDLAGHERVTLGHF
ncbi:peptide chain release factor N(5)-glutamine methyltransferase [Porticoccus sp. GXU_MW_L64]